MEKTNKYDRIAADMKAFKALQSLFENSGNDSKDALPDDRDVMPSEVLMKIYHTLNDCAGLAAKAALLSKLQEIDKEEDRDVCGSCIYDGGCRGVLSVLVCWPGGDNTIMTLEELVEEIGDVFSEKKNVYEVRPVPGAKDLYFIIPEKKPLRRKEKIYYALPAIVFGVDEEQGEMVSPNASQLYEAARYFERNTTIVSAGERSMPVFCFD